MPASIELFDTHCHLNLPEHFPDPDLAVRESLAAGVTRLNVVGIDLESARSALKIAERNQGVWAILGCHPNSAASFDEGMLEAIRAHQRHPRCVAVGEIGLDYHWDFATKQQQGAALEAQLDLAEELDRPVVFHCREAYHDLLDLLESRPKRPYLFHCWSGSSDDLERAVRLDAHFGLDGPLTYKKSESLREMASSMPRDRVLLETDSPYMAPEPHRGKPNRPAWLPLVNLALAACWKVSPEESAAITTENARRFFGV